LTGWGWVMPSVEAIIQYGDLSELPLFDEPDLLVQAMMITPTREREVWKGESQAVEVVRFTNPLLTFSYRGILASRSGLGNLHPGELVDQLANYEGQMYGFDPEEGVMVYEDPELNFTLEDPADASFSVVHYPFIGGAFEILWSDDEAVTWNDGVTAGFSN
jgi:hypothetical protein